MFTRVEIRTHKRKLAFSLTGKIPLEYAIESAGDAINDHMTEEEKDHVTISIRKYK